MENPDPAVLLTQVPETESEPYWRLCIVSPKSQLICILFITAIILQTTFDPYESRIWCILEHQLADTVIQNQLYRYCFH